MLSKRDLLADGAGGVRGGGLEGSGWEGGFSAWWRSPRRPARGLDELRQRIFALLPEAPARAEARSEPAAEFEAEHRVYRPAGEGGYSIEREGDGAFRIVGRGVELLFERHDLSNEEALGYLEQRLNEIGVIAALAKAGFEPGDEVRVGEQEFELHV